LRIEYEFIGLFHRTLRVLNARIDGVDVALTTVPPPTTPAAATPSLETLLTPPLDILVDSLRVGKTNVAQDGKPVFASDSLDLAATWTSKSLHVAKLALRAPDGKIDLAAAIDSYKDLRGTGKVDVDWRIADETQNSRRAVATVSMDGDGKLTRFVVALAQPLVLNAHGTVAPTDKALPWTVDLDVPAFDPATLSKDASLKSLALSLKGGGDKAGGTLTGSVDADKHRVVLDPFKFSRDDKTFTVETLRLSSPEASGTLSATAKVQLDAKPVGAEASVDWADVELPTELAGQPIATHGHVEASGSAQKYAAHGKLSLGPPKQPSDIEFKLDGTPEKVTLEQFDVIEPQTTAKTRGILHTTGDIALKPKVGWNLKANAENLDPGVFAKDWPGAINLALATNGTLEKEGAEGKLKLERLDGTLRQRKLAGAADLSFAPPLKIDGKLDISSGQSRVSLVGQGGTQTDVQIALAIASLGDWLPKASGIINGNIAARGAWPKLDAAGKVTGAKIVSGDTHIDSFVLDLDVHDVSAPSGRERLDVKGLAQGSYVFDTVALAANGTQGAHHIEFAAHGKPLNLDLALDGALAARKKGGSDWRGTIQSLALTSQGQPAWNLAQPTSIAWVDDAFRLDDLCLNSGTSRLCAGATQSAQGATQAKFTIEHLPLKMITRLTSPDAPLKVEGELNGNGNIARSKDGALTGHATIASEAGALTYPDSASQALLSYKGFHIDAALSPQQHDITIAADLNDGGRIDGHIVIGASPTNALPLSGNIAANIGNLSFVDLLTPKLSGTKGKVDAKFTLGGTTVQPVVDGALTLADFATEVPAAGLKLHDGNIAVRSRDGVTFDIDGSIASAEGKLAIKGSAATGTNAPVNITIKGDDFLAADIPGARLHISPDLKIERDATRLDITGSIGIPQMYVDLSKLPGGGSPSVRSPDVVVIDEPPPEATAAIPATVDITLKLGAGEKLSMDLRQGTEVHLIGYGLDADLGGQLVVHQTRGATPIGRGQLQLNGTFKAYGQDLKIEQGRLLFAGTPVENPGLDIRATRSFQDQNVVVGLQVRGTALVPLLSVFSTPAMEQSDALSYLVAGKPLSQLKGGEGNAVGSAASALGTAGGDLLAKSIGAKLGIDDVGVADNTAVGGAALTVGKYLNPRLYVGYGVGLFTPGQVVTVRYKLTRLFDFEMQNGTLSNRAGINYRIEK
jgi:translocation and assembly module TamB